MPALLRPLDGTTTTRSGTKITKKSFRRGSVHASTLDLRAVHHPARARIERVAAVHRAAVVPHHEIARAPVVPPRQRVARRVRPDLVEQRVALFERHPLDVRVAPAPEIQ